MSPLNSGKRLKVKEFIWQTPGERYRNLGTLLYRCIQSESKIL